MLHELKYSILELQTVDRPGQKRAGVENAWIVPFTKPTQMKSQKSIRSVMMMVAIASITTQLSTCAHTNTRRFGKRSAITPPHSANSICGTEDDSETQASAIGDPVSV